MILDFIHILLVTYTILNKLIIIIDNVVISLIGALNYILQK